MINIKRLLGEVKSIFREEVDLVELTDPARAGVRLRKFVLLLRETFRSVKRHDSLRMGSALAFKSLTALVPMLAISLAVVAALGPEYVETFVDALKKQLPANAGMDKLFDQIRVIADNAKAIAGVGFLLLFVTAYSLLSSVEQAFNNIWQSSKKRNWQQRVVAYVATLIIVPIMISMSVYLVAKVGMMTQRMEQVTQQAIGTLGIGSAEDPSEKISEETSVESPEEVVKSKPPKKKVAAKSVAEKSEADAPEELEKEPKIMTVSNSGSQSFFVRMSLILASTLLTIIAFTGVYYFLPFTMVRLPAALAGGAFAGVLFDITKVAFRYYAGWAASSNMAKVYAGVMAFPLILLLLWLVWIILIIGAELSFTTQNYRNLAARAEIEKRGISCRIYLAVRTVVEAAEFFHRGEAPQMFCEVVAEKLNVPLYVIREIANTLEGRQILRQVAEAEDSYLPARDITEMTVGDIVRAVSPERMDIPNMIEDEVHKELRELFTTSENDLHKNLDSITVSHLAVK